MRHIEFYNREKGTMELARILGTYPTLITFIYGPINSGKTELITNLIKTLPESQKVFYINLRGRFISNYDEFIKVLFDVEHEARYISMGAGSVLKDGSGNGDAEVIHGMTWDGRHVWGEAIYDTKKNQSGG
ncbi:MAG: ATP-binding protein [Euryarchaeota archaeon]|nr:ATP-binding protein [Euryarchaeota archaeon]